MHKFATVPLGTAVHRVNQKTGATYCKVEENIQVIRRAHGGRILKKFVHLKVNAPELPMCSNCESVFARQK